MQPLAHNTPNGPGTSFNTSRTSPYIPSTTKQSVSTVCPILLKPLSMGSILSPQNSHHLLHSGSQIL
ncbi:hypothetical protein BDZ94DRAFT_1275356 [Collybia nuda]|uniref:Uncharacterized protein n=1 Tax=Collybia nuda TaxID=64659 RepID=A0A9P5XTH0_9AGAR|nr:hypothetical protein BDZ94DRAFT_1275356 [Collybia nuda]